jgi:cytochrome c biogenesis protein CcmG/thiol:disulfide interchange protein DsbE
LVVAVNDSEDAIRGFVGQGGYSFPVMLDPDNIGGRYGVRAIPTVVVVDSDGRIVKTLVGGVTAADLSSLVDDLTR